MNIEKLHVIVVGGATAGAGAALLFARAGARVTLVERVPRPQAVGAGIGLAENGLAVLESLGLGRTIAAVGTPCPAVRIVDGTGRVLMMPREPVPRVLMLRRGDLQQVLLDALAAQPGVDAVFGAEAIRTDTRGGIEMRTPNGLQALRGDLVIGADGLHSCVRRMGRHGATLGRPGVSYLRALVSGPAARSEEAWTAAGLFGSFAVGRSTYAYASLGTDELRRACRDRDLEALRAAWARAYPPAEAILAGVDRWEDLLVHPVVRVRCRHWFDGRQVLIGDAAHAMAPNLGQGANSALVDGAVLLDEVRGAADLGEALSRYQQRRQAAVDTVARMAAALGALAEITNPLGRCLRDRWLMPLLNRAGGRGGAAKVLQEPTQTLLEIGHAGARSGHASVT